MAITYPGTLDTFTNPGSGDNLNTTGVVHHTQHSDLNDAVTQLEAKVGATSSGVTTSHDYKLSGITGTAKAGPDISASFFGAGGDGGPYTFDGSTTILGIVPAASVYTLTKPLFVTSMTVNNGVTIITNGYRIFATGTITVNSTGIIQANGNAGGNAAATGSGSAASILTVAEFKNTLGGAAGTAGTSSTTPSNGGSGTASTAGPGGSGGGAGGGGDDAGGANGTSGSVGVRTGPIRSSLFNYLTGFGDGGTPNLANNTYSGIRGAAGGRGAGDGSNSGGGGGGSGDGGGVVVIAASAITNSGTISALGGNGGNGGHPTVGTNIGGGGGAGGGGGGIVCLVYKTLTNSGTISAAGGTKGTGNTGLGTGTTGSDGTNGEAGTVFKYNLTSGAWE